MGELLPSLVSLVALVLCLVIVLYRRGNGNGNSSHVLDYSIKAQQSALDSLRNQAHTLDIRREEDSLDWDRERQCYERYVGALERYARSLQRIALRCLTEGETLPVEPCRDDYLK